MTESEGSHVGQVDKWGNPGVRPSRAFVLKNRGGKPEKIIDSEVSQMWI